jgi:signal peptidase I
MFGSEPLFVAQARGLRSRINFPPEQAARLLHKPSPARLDDSSSSQRAAIIREVNFSTTGLGRKAQAGFYLALILGCLSLILVLLRPVSAMVAAILCFAVAWGIYKHCVGAALFGAGLSLCAFTFTVGKAINDQPAPAIRVIALIYSVPCLAWTWMMVRAAIDLRDDPVRAKTDWPWLVGLFLIVAFEICTSPYSLPSASMKPTLLAGDCFLVDTLTISAGSNPKRDDLVVFHYPANSTQVFVKRIAGVAGDRIHLEHKTLFRNGAPLHEVYAVHETDYEDDYRDNFPGKTSSNRPASATGTLENSVVNGEVVVPQGQYFVLGDNRDDSLDSRYWGFVSKTQIVGRPFLVYASFGLKNQQDPLEFRSVLNTRWNRILKWI